MRDLRANHAKVEAISSLLLSAHLPRLHVREFSDSADVMEIATCQRKSRNEESLLLVSNQPILTLRQVHVPIQEATTLSQQEYSQAIRQQEVVKERH